MCLTTMETKPKRTKSGFVFTTATPASELRWRLLRVAAQDDEAVALGRAGAVGATIRKYLGRQPKRTPRAKLAKGERRRESAKEGLHPAGAMAPENTTQYLMSRVYEDMAPSEQTHTTTTTTTTSSTSPTTRVYGDALSPRSVYAALDCDYDGCLAYQQRDFEQAYGLQWQW